MALKIFTIIMALFVAEITFLATKEPKKLKNKERKILTANLEFDKLKGFSIDEKGVTNSLHASKVLRFDNKEQLFDIDAKYIDKNITHLIKAKEAIHQNDTIVFKERVDYQNSKEIEIVGKNLEYNIKTKVISSAMPFELKKDNTTLYGKNFIYDMKQELLQANKIKYIQKVDER